MKVQWLMLILLAMSQSAEAGSLRCGTRLVIMGDSIKQLTDACGQPALKYKAKESLKGDGRYKTTGVTNWVYERGRKRNMVVSVRSGKVVKIAVH